MEDCNDQTGKDRNGYDMRTKWDVTQKATETVTERTYWTCVTELTG
jgi:hypothetical protein